MRILEINNSESESDAPRDDEVIEFHLHQRETDAFLYFDLTLACMLTEDLKSAVRFSDFEFEENPDASNYEPNGLIKLRGVVEDGHRFLEVFRNFQQKIRDEENPMGDQIQDFIAQQDERWLRDDVALPKLFRATRIEQLLAWLQDDGLEDAEKAPIAEELVGIEPTLRTNPIVECYLNI
jgi:hypothetical protein